MPATTPRYDEHADWYVEFSREWEPETADLVPSDLTGQRVLDLCCGWGVLSRVLAGRGAEVVAVDVSAKMLDPCFPGRAEPYVMPSWPPEQGYWAEGWWTTRREGVGGHVGANHRTLATYLNAVLAEGLEFVEFAETGDDVPRILVGRCRRPT